MTQKPMNQARYSRHRGISPARVSILIRDDKIPDSCYETQPNGRRLIDALKADKALSENLDQIYNRPIEKPSKTQIKAHSWAWEGAENREPIWEVLRYLVKLQELSPDAVKITFPVLDEEGIIFEYKGYDLDCGVTSERLCVDILLDEDDYE